jgi:hypothetical protein
MKLVYNPMKIFFLKKTWNTISTMVKYWRIKLISKTKKKNISFLKGKIEKKMQKQMHKVTKSNVITT